MSKYINMDRLTKLRELTVQLIAAIDELEKWTAATTLDDGRIDLGSYPDNMSAHWSQAVKLIPASFQVLRDLHLTHYEKEINSLITAININNI